MPRITSKRSLVWEHFEKVSDVIVRCLHCKKELRYLKSTTSMTEHIKRIHPFTDYRIQKKNNDEQDNTAPSILVVAGPSCSSNPQEPISPPQGRLTNTPPSKPKRQLQLFGGKPCQLTLAEQQKIDKSLVEMIIDNFCPLSIVESEKFKVYSLNLNKNYTPPNRKKITQELIPNYYNSLRLKIKDMLNNIEHVSITTDIWTSRSTQGFLTVTAHFIYNFSLKSIVLSTVLLEDSHTSFAISEELKKIFVEWDITHKIVAVITDNGANIKKAVIEYLKLYHLPCVAHTLNLCVGDSLKSDDFEQICTKSRKVVAFFKRSVAAADALKKMQVRMGLPVYKVKQETPTRWNSRFEMIKRLIELKEPLSAVIASLPQAPPFLTADEWSILEDCVPILQPLDAATTAISGENYCTISIIIPIVRGLLSALHKITPSTQAGITLKSVLQETIFKRLGTYETLLAPSKATFLDPRFKYVAFGLEENAKSAENKIKLEVEKLLKIEQSKLQPEPCTSSPSTSAGDIWEWVDQKLFNVETTSTPTIASTLLLRQYKEKPYLNRNCDPLSFWELHKDVFPQLTELACKYLCIPATSVPSERVFSKAGHLLNERRSSLLDKHVNYILFLKGNMSYL